MDMIDNDLVAFIVDEPFISKEDAFGSFTRWLIRNDKPIIDFYQFSESLIRLKDSNRIELIIDSYDDHYEFISYISNIKTRSVEGLKISGNEMYNRRISNLNRVMNFIIIKENASSDDLINKFCYSPGSFVKDLKEDELWSLVSFLKDKNCVGEERIDNFSFMFLPLDFSIDVFIEINNYDDNKEKVRLESIEKSKKIPFYKPWIIIISFFSIMILILIGVAYTEVYLPWLIPSIPVLILIFYRKKRMGER
jgi:hypothetical protein